MGLFRRVNDIVTANLHDMVDRFEDPQKMLKQAIREMESAIAAALDRAVQVVANEKLLGRQIEEQRRQADRWRRAAEAAVAASDDARARRALRRKADHQKLLAALEQNQQAAAEAGSRLRTQIDAMRVKLGEARRRLAALAARQHLAATRRHVAAGSCAIGATPLATFERMAERIEQAEAEAEACEELNGSWWPGEGEDEEEPEADIEAELAELKERR